MTTASTEAPSNRRTSDSALKGVFSIRVYFGHHNRSQPMNPSPTPARFSPERALDLGRQTLGIEAAAVEALQSRLDGDFAAAVALILNSRGRLIVSGMGKSGHIARKIAATMASTGTPALYVHPGEASHGDLGMIIPSDVVIAISNSGETAELSDLIAYTRRFSIPQSTLCVLQHANRDRGPIAECWRG